MRFQLNTTFGDIVLRLDPRRAPITVENFASYAREGFYNDTVFHRVIDGFMIQGGGFSSGMTRKEPGETIKNEADNGLSNVTGTVAMARSANPDSASSQFFINVEDNLFLDYKSSTPEGFGYCVFGEVESGLQIAKRIAKVATSSQKGHQDVPSEEVVIASVTELESS